MKNFTFKREWMDEMAALPDDFRARIILAANDYAYFDKLPDDPIVAYAMRHIIAFINRRKAAKNRNEKRATIKPKHVAAKAEIHTNNSKKEVESNADSVIDNKIITEQPEASALTNAPTENHIGTRAKSTISPNPEKSEHQTSKTIKSLGSHSQKHPKNHTVRDKSITQTMTFRDFKRMKQAT